MSAIFNVVQRQKAVSAYFTSEQMLSFALAVLYTCRVLCY